MRGTRLHLHLECHLDRFIPAHAGNSLVSGVVPQPDTVHPRACGELYGSPDPTDRGDGSSPRMRGTRLKVLFLVGGHRFIPAHAGNSYRRSVGYGFNSVHPRACGELTDQPSITSSGDGSSPRMRGTHHDVALSRLANRFIPAHAGNSIKHRHATAAKTVHPRACGELQYYVGPFRARYGSSPRMRGTPRRYWRLAFL